MVTSENADVIRGGYIRLNVNYMKKSEKDILMAELLNNSKSYDHFYEADSQLFCEQINNKYISSDDISKIFEKVRPEELITYCKTSLSLVRFLDFAPSFNDDNIDIDNFEDPVSARYILSLRKPFAEPPVHLIKREGSNDRGEAAETQSETFPEKYLVENTVDKLILDYQNLESEKEDVIFFVSCMPLKARALLWGEEFDDEYLNRKYGPINGDSRMLLCCEFEVCDEHEYDEDYIPDEWFGGSCFICRKRIMYKHWAIRRPIRNCGWSGCYCSFECLKLDPNVDDEVSDLVFKELGVWHPN